MSGPVRTQTDAEGRRPPEERALLDEWARRFRPALTSFFRRRTRAGADVDDLVQDLFVRLARRSDLQSVEKPEQYLFQAAANVLRDRARRDIARASGAHVQLEDAYLDTDVTPERVLLGKDALERLIAGLDALKERTRAVFMLYHFEGMTQKEISRALGVSVSTVEKQMAKANAHLLKCLGDLP